MMREKNETNAIECVTNTNGSFDMRQAWYEAGIYMTLVKQNTISIGINCIFYIGLYNKKQKTIKTVKIHYLKRFVV